MRLTTKTMQRACFFPLVISSQRLLVTVGAFSSGGGGVGRGAIEVEVKFALSPQQFKAIAKDSLEAFAPPEIKKLEDSYFDLEGACLLKRDVWLRRRGEVYELKVPAFSACRKVEEGMGSPLRATAYEEITGEKRISERLKSLFPEKFKGVESMRKFASYSSTRYSYVVHDAHSSRTLSLDYDEALFKPEGFPPSTYSILEIEGMCRSPSEVIPMERAILGYAADLGVHSASISKPPRVPGKLEEFLSRFRPELYKILCSTRNTR